MPTAPARRVLPVVAAAALAAVTGVNLPAQQPPATGPAAPATRPAATPVTPGTRPGTTKPAISLTFKDAPLDAVLEYLSDAAGFVVVKDGPVEGRVTVLSRQPVTPDEAVVLLNTVLKTSGLTAVRTGTDGRVLKILGRDAARKAAVPVHFGADPDDVAATDEVITQVIPIKSVDAVKLRQDLAPILGPDADLAANGASNAIVVTDSSANVRRLVQIIAVLDRHEGGNLELKKYNLKYADAPAAARLIIGLLRPDANQPPPKGDQKPKEPTDQQLRSRVTAVGDDRTNTLFVTAPADAIKVIDGIVKDLESNPTTASEVRTFELKFANAAAAAKMVASIFKGEEGPPKPEAVRPHDPSEQVLRARVVAVADDRTNTLVVTAPTDSMKVIADLLQKLDSDTTLATEVKVFPLKHAEPAAAARLVASVYPPDVAAAARRPDQAPPPHVTVAPDERTNSLIITTSGDAMKGVADLIQKIDSDPTASSTVRVFSLKFADATSAAKLVTSIFKPDDPNPAAPHRQDVASAAPHVTAAADDRTNSLVVTAPEESMKVIADLIQKLDSDPANGAEIKVFPLNYADAVTTAKLVTSIFKPDDANPAAPKPTGQIALAPRVTAVADDRTNSLVVTAPPETVKAVGRLLQELDANPAAANSIKVVPLRHADAYDAQYLLLNLFNPDPGKSSSGGPAPATPIRGKLTAVADSRTNTVALQAPAEVLTAAEAVLKQIDSDPTTDNTLFIYRLRNGQALRMEAVLNVLFGATPAGTGALGAAGLARAGLPNQAQAGGVNALGATGLTGIGSRRGTVTSDPLGGAGLAAGLGGLNPALAGRALTAAGGAPLTNNLSANSSRAINELTGEVFVVADPDTNSLLVSSATKYLDQVKQIIAELDRPVPQVLIKVLVAEVTHENSADFGVDFSVLNRRGTVGANGGPPGGQTGVATFGLPQGNQGLVVSLLEANVNATLHALATEGKLDVLSRPYILASDNQLASITVGNEVPFVTNSRITDQGQQINTIEYQDVGIILSVTPHINPDGLVIMDVIPEISQLTSSTVPVSAGVTAPVIAKRAAQSRVGIQNGSTIVIGGLMEDRKTANVSKIPLLGDLPLLGPLFSRTVIDKTKTELLIFLTPHVAPAPNDLGAMSADEVRGARVAPGAVAPGTLSEHLHGMQRGASPTTLPATRPTEPDPDATIEIPIRRAPRQPFNWPAAGIPLGGRGAGTQPTTQPGGDRTP